MRRLYTIVLLIVSHALCPGQSTRVGTEPTPILSASPFTRTGIDAWSAGGATVAEAGVTAAPLSNPALIRMSGPSLYLEAGKRFDANWILDLDYDGQIIVPAFASVGSSVENISFQIGYANTYNERISTSITFTTEDFPDGTGEFYEFQRTVNVHTYFGSMSFSPNDHLSVGATVGLNNVRTHEGVARASARSSGSGAMINLGVLVKLSDGLACAGSLKYAATTKVDVTVESPPVLLPNPRPGSSYLVQPSDWSYTAGFPWTAEAGICWIAASAITILSSIEFQEWSRIADNYRDIVNIHVGAAFRISPGVSLRCGFFTQSDPITSTSGYVDQTFLTAGIQWSPHAHVVLSGSILDSHLFGKSGSHSNYWQTDNSFHQTYVSSGIGYTF